MATKKPVSEETRRRDDLVREFIGVADSLARRFHRKFPDLIERDDAIQVARLALVRSAKRVTDAQTAAGYLKKSVEGGLHRYLRDNARLVRVSRRAHETGTHPFNHASLDAVNDDGVAMIDTLAAPAPKVEKASEAQDSALAMLDKMPANDAAIVRKRIIENQSLREVADELGMSRMMVSRREKAALTKLREAMAP